MMGIFIKEVIQIMTPDTYVLAWTVVPIMTVAYQVQGIYYFYVNTVFYNKSAVRYVFIATLTGNFISIILSALTTPILGLQTPAIVLLIANIATTTIVYLMSKKFEPVDFNIKRMIYYVILLAITMIICLFYDIKNPIGPIQVSVIAYKMIVAVIVIGMLFWEDRIRIKGVVVDYLRSRNQN